MKFKLIILILYFPFVQSICQEYWFHQPFNSVFNDLKSGSFTGTINGILVISGEEERKIILDFQGSNCELKIEPEKEEVYDVSTKIYIGETTSKKSKIIYETYGQANHLVVLLNGQKYAAGIFDGAFDDVIDGLDYEYIAENNTEYLVLKFLKPVELNNYEELDIPGTINKKNKIIIHPGSVLVFAIKR